MAPMGTKLLMEVPPGHHCLLDPPQARKGSAATNGRREDGVCAAEAKSPLDSRPVSRRR